VSKNTEYALKAAMAGCNYRATWAERRRTGARRAGLITVMTFSARNSQTERRISMEDMKYHVVKNGTKAFQIFYGRKPPQKLPKNEGEAKQRAYEERWVPSNWTLVASFDDEDSAKKKFKEEKSKVANVPKGAKKAKTKERDK
jgi:hypothetical protein